MAVMMTATMTDAANVPQTINHRARSTLAKS